MADELEHSRRLPVVGGHGGRCEGAPSAIIGWAPTGHAWTQLPPRFAAGNRTQLPPRSAAGNRTQLPPRSAAGNRWQYARLSPATLLGPAREAETRH